MSRIPTRIGDVCKINRNRFLRGSLGTYTGLDEDDDIIVERLEWQEYDSIIGSWYEEYEFNRGHIEVIKKVRI